MSRVRRIDNRPTYTETTTWYQIHGREMPLRWIFESSMYEKDKPLHKRVGFYNSTTVSGANLSVAFKTLKEALQLVSMLREQPHIYEAGEIKKFSTVAGDRFPTCETVAYLTPERIVMFLPSTLMEYPELPPQIMPNEECKM